MTQNEWTVLVLLLLFAGLAALMWRGWRRRAVDQELLFDELPPAPDDPGEPRTGPMTGVYVGSVRAGHWQDRITRAPLGVRSGGVLSEHAGGLRLELGGGTVWIPREDLVSVTRESKLANKVVPGGGLLVVRWRVHGRFGATLIDSGFRGDEKDQYERWTTPPGDHPTSEETQ